MEEKVLNCRSKKEFTVSEVIAELGKYGLLDEDERLLHFLGRLGSEFLIEEIRGLYYDVGFKNYNEWLEDEESSRVFWDNVKDAVDDAEMKLTPDDAEAFDDATHGRAGQELFAHIASWFWEHAFIRTDLNKWNCRLFRYLDSHNILKTNIMGEIFSEHYEDIRKIETIFEDLMYIIDLRLPYFEAIAMKKQVDVDERMFESGVQIHLSFWEEGILEAAHHNLERLKNLIYDTIFLSD